MSRLRLGEVIAGAGAIGLLLLLFMDWFVLDSTLQFALERDARSNARTTGWSTLGWFMAVLLVLSMLAAAALVALAVTAGAVAAVVAAQVITVTGGGITALVLVLRVVTEPGLGVAAPNEFVDVKAVAWLGTACALASPPGAWISMAAERTDAPESAYTPPPARPAPPVADA
jgi:hypothetical protein